MKKKARRDRAFSLEGPLPNFEKLTFAGRPDDWFITAKLAEFLRKRLAIPKKDWFGPSRETLPLESWEYRSGQRRLLVRKMRLRVLPPEKRKA